MINFADALAADIFIGNDKIVFSDIAKKVLKMESKAIEHLALNVGNNFNQLADKILKLKGLVVITGIGKSGIIGQKIAATLTSTGTRACYLNAADALHGDLGLVSPKDLILAISNSGETDELQLLIPKLKSKHCKIALFTGNVYSSLAGMADWVINVEVAREADMFNIVPTTSSIAALAMGDALAISLMQIKKFTQKDFSTIHPGGELGRRLQLLVKEVMRKGKQIPKVNITDPFSKVVQEINKKKLGATCVVSRLEKLKGIIVDGDIRRAILKNPDIKYWTAERLRNKYPKVIQENMKLNQALQLMEKNAIYHLVVVNIKGELCGFLHLHDLLGRGKIRIL
jgi:arabinose-5-phosphate isomerase